MQAERDDASADMELFVIIPEDHEHEEERVTSVERLNGTNAIRQHNFLHDSSRFSKVWQYLQPNIQPKSLQ